MKGMTKAKSPVGNKGKMGKVATEPTGTSPKGKFKKGKKKGKSPFGS